MLAGNGSAHVADILPVTFVANGSRCAHGLSCALSFLRNTVMRERIQVEVTNCSRGENRIRVPDSRASHSTCLATLIVSEQNEILRQYSGQFALPLVVNGQ